MRSDMNTFAFAYRCVRYFFSLSVRPSILIHFLHIIYFGGLFYHFEMEYPSHILFCESASNVQCVHKCRCWLLPFILSIYLFFVFLNTKIDLLALCNQIESFTFVKKRIIFWFASKKWRSIQRKSQRESTGKWFMN